MLNIQYIEYNNPIRDAIRIRKWCSDVMNITYLPETIINDMLTEGVMLCVRNYKDIKYLSACVGMIGNIDFFELVKQHPQIDLSTVCRVSSECGNIKCFEHVFNYMLSLELGLDLDKLKSECLNNIRRHQEINR